MVCVRQDVPPLRAPCELEGEHQVGGLGGAECPQRLESILGQQLFHVDARRRRRGDRDHPSTPHEPVAQQVGQQERAEQEQPRVAPGEQLRRRRSDGTGRACDYDHRVQPWHQLSVEASSWTSQAILSPLIDAHRGECGTPGLTAAERYSHAISMGVDYVEIDVRRSSDGVYVNYHDDRTASGHEVSALPFAALRQELGAELLTIDEVIELVDGKVGLHVDLKEGGQELDI